MISVRIGAEADREAPAATLVDLAEESADILLLAAPACLDRDPAPVGEKEGGDIDRIGEAMLAHPRAGPAVDRATGISSERLDPAHRRAEMASRRGLDRLPHPASEGAGERAGHRAEIGHRSADLKQLDRAERRAAAVEPPVLEGPEPDLIARQLGQALTGRGIVSIGAARRPVERRRRPRRRRPPIAARNASAEEKHNRNRKTCTHRRRLAAPRHNGQGASG